MGVPIRAKAALATAKVTRPPSWMGSAPNPVRQSADRVLHEDGGKEEGRYHYSDEADRRAQLAK